jgi:hypothetical protein
MSDTANHGNEVRSLSEEFQRVQELVNAYYPGLMRTVECALAVCAAMSLEGRTKPLSMMFVATSGYGKSAVVQMLYPLDGLGLHHYVYRSDKFTPKAFVSHVATASGKKCKTDMLWKLQGKVLVTKELSTMFRGRDDDLKDTFAVLIPVLDGKGFVSDSGAKGRRGYQYDIVFNWIGATTPLPDRVHRMMYQLGTRLLFYEVPSIMPSDDELFEYTMRDDASLAEVKCREAVNRFLIRFFKEYTVGCVPASGIEIPDAHGREISHWARFLATARREVKFEKDGSSYTPVLAAPSEGPWKIVDYFKELVRGHALLHERLEVNAADVALVAHIAISSIPGYLRPIVRKLRKDGRITSTECERICRITRPTARMHLLEASLLELGTLKKGTAASNLPDVLTLSPEFQWLRNLERRM